MSWLVSSAEKTALFCIRKKTNDSNDPDEIYEKIFFPIEPICYKHFYSFL